MLFQSDNLIPRTASNHCHNIGVFKFLCFFFLISGAFHTAPQVSVAIWIGQSAHGMFEKYETHDKHFSLRFSLFHFQLPVWKCFRLAAPGKEGGGHNFCLFNSQNLIPEHLHLLLVTEAELCIDLDHWTLPVPYDPIIEKKKMYFLYLLDVPTTKLGYALFPPHPTPSKEVLSYLFKDPQNKYFSWLPPPIIAK